MYPSLPPSRDRGDEDSLLDAKGLCLHALGRPLDTTRISTASQHLHGVLRARMRWQNPQQAPNPPLSFVRRRITGVLTHDHHGIALQQLLLANESSLTMVPYSRAQLGSLATACHPIAPRRQLLPVHIRTQKGRKLRSHNEYHLLYMCYNKVRTTNTCH